MPFWLSSNVNGKVDPQSSNFINEIELSRVYEISPDLSFEAGTNLVGRLSKDNSLHFTELYGSVSYRAFRLDVGRFNQPIGLNNHSLSVGSMMVSNNAIPVTRITISNPDFVTVPFTNGFLEYKGMFSHGWFTEDRYVDDAYLHQKYLYLKFNIEDFSAIGGIVHNALWGGTSENPNIGSLPQSFSDYLRVITGSSADPDSDAPGGEISNTLGNSIAAYEFGATYDFESLTVSATRLFYLEDGVSRRFRSPWDGSWGLNLIFKEPFRLLQAVTYEHVNTRRQDSRAFQARGRANYYNHFLYRTGWSNYGRVLGIPLITYDTETDRIDNNILVGHHLGAAGYLSKVLDYKMFATYSRNYGIVGGKVPPETVDFPSRREDQYSLLVALNYRVPGTSALTLGMSLSADTGDMYEENLGFMGHLTWNFR
ncbi:MAG: capsule assembly Wzi family protein [Balneolaceae bacterium]|nr:capsule assembly Wzi family protein [Balneolaceae bacterium]